MTRLQIKNIIMIGATV
ncbi:unnamed protein product, partial [Rotaria sordida]